jgi:putative oxidoreductase
MSMIIFFAISGAYKLFNAAGKKRIYETMAESKIPLPRQMAYVVSGVEFIVGCLLHNVACIPMWRADLCTTKAFLSLNVSVLPAIGWSLTVLSRISLHVSKGDLPLV